MTQSKAQLSLLDLYLSLLFICMQVLTVQGSVYWAYVPDPPLLQPVSWEMSSVPVYVNDTVLLGSPSSVHIQPQQANISYKGYSDMYPMCFSMNGRRSHCLWVFTLVHYDDVTIAGVTAGRATSIGKIPRDIPLCAAQLGISKGIDVPWRLCVEKKATAYTLEEGFTLLNWGSRAPTQVFKPKVPPILAPPRGYPVQTEIWKLLAAFRKATRWNKEAQDLEDRYPQACVPRPFMLLVGDLTIKKDKATYHLLCPNCTLTNCIQGVSVDDGVLVVRQPPFIMLPVNISKPWYSNPGLELWDRVQNALSRPRRELGLLILGIVSLITIIATTVTASISLTQAVQAADTVDHLAHNTSLALGTQEDIDKRVETRLNALYDAVKFLGDELQSLKLRTRIQCHSDYHWICVTPKRYNVTETSWGRVLYHLEGVWSNSNVSLDLLQLHQEILNIAEAPHAKLPVAQLADNFVNSLFSHIPSLSRTWYAIGSIIGVLILMLLFMCLFPCVMKFMLTELYKVRAIVRNQQRAARDKTTRQP